MSDELGELTEINQELHRLVSLQEELKEQTVQLQRRVERFLRSKCEHEWELRSALMYERTYQCKHCLLYRSRG